MADMEAIVKRSLEIIEAAYHAEKQCICFFSGGKDSVAVLNLLEKVYAKPDIHLVFMPFVDGLPETERVVQIAAKKGYKTVNLYQHWAYFGCKAHGAYCKKQGKPKKLFDIYAECREDMGDLPIFYGAKSSDGMWRRLVTSKDNNKARNVHAPIWDWSMYEVLLYIRQNKLEYLKQEGSRVSGCDLSAKYILWAHENSPESYAALKREFPFLDVVVKRKELING